MIEHMNERTTQPKSVLALGMFDGVHLAHQALVRQAAEAARALDAQTVAFTFTDAPGKLLHLPVTSLSTPAQRISWLQAAGADRVDMVDFTQAFADLSPEGFLDYLQERYRIAALAAGFKFDLLCRDPALVFVERIHHNSIPPVCSFIFSWC